MVGSPRVLHLVGSVENDFYRDLSLVYARDCLRATHSDGTYQWEAAVVTPDWRWRFVSELSDAAIGAAAPLSTSQAVGRIRDGGYDVALPQMFCIPGMTTLRSLLDLVRLPFVGNPSEVMAIAANKVETRTIVEANGVAVPEGETLGRGESPTIPCPAVVKPADADNSLGVTFVPSQDGYPAALATAWEHSETVLVERFIELGREVRCGVLAKETESGVELECLPLQEYRLDRFHNPIRGYQDKLTKNAAGKLDLTSKFRSTSRMVDRDDPIVQSVWDAAKRCHLALGCRDYSLFDFRIDPNGQPFFLEAGLYCSFAPNSILTSMMEATGCRLESFLHQMIHQAIRRDRRPNSSNRLNLEISV